MKLRFHLSGSGLKAQVVFAVPFVLFSETFSQSLIGELAIEVGGT